MDPSCFTPVIEAHSYVYMYIYIYSSIFIHVFESRQETVFGFQPINQSTQLNHHHSMSAPHTFLVLLLALAAHTVAKTVPELGIGLGFAYGDSNVLHWLDYLGPPQSARVFVHTFIESRTPSNNTADWRTFVSNSWDADRATRYGDQFGVSFAGAPVDSLDGFQAAVEDLRSRARGKGDTPTTSWIAQSHPDVMWGQLFWPLSTSATGVMLMQTGVPEDYLPKLRQRDIKVVGIWDLDCSELAFETIDTSDPAYYRERWEQYRLIYLGGLWMSEQGIVDIELYNEPDKDSCINDEKMYVETMQINSAAFRDAAADLGRQAPKLIAPSTAATFSTRFGSSLFPVMHKKFGNEMDDPSFSLFDAYSYHAYGDGAACTQLGKVDERCMPNGHALRTKQDRAVSELAAHGAASMETHVTEFNCFTFRAAEELEGHVFDRPETAACVGAQIGSLMVRSNIPTSMSLHKLVQNRVNTPSGVGKNGVLFAQTDKPPFDISGSTRAFEVFRLITKRVINRDGGAEIVKIPSPSHSFDRVADRVIAWGLKHTGGRVLSIFISNQGDDEESLMIDFKALGVPPGEYLTMNEPDQRAGHNVERGILGIQITNQTQGIPKIYFLEAVVPLVTTRLVTVSATAACGVDAERRYSDDTVCGLGVTMDPSPKMKVPGLAESEWGCRFPDPPWSPLPRAALVHFDRAAIPDPNTIVRALLKLYLIDTSYWNENEVLTVIGFKSRVSDWSEMTWDAAGVFKRGYRPSTPRTVKDNIIDWSGPGEPHVVAGQVKLANTEIISDLGGIFVQVDVTEAIVDRGLDSFAIVRMVRFDESGEGSSKLPQDIPTGFVSFAGTKKMLDRSESPRLLISVETNDPVPPYPPAPTPTPPPTASCSYASRVTLQPRNAMCRKKGLYLTHSLSSKDTKLYLKSKTRAVGDRRAWKPKIVKANVKGGYQATIFAAGRKTKKSYLATGRTPVLGEKSDTLIRIVPYNRCDNVTLVSESRMRRGQPAYLRVDCNCGGLKWGRKKDLCNTFTIKAA